MTEIIKPPSAEPQRPWTPGTGIPERSRNPYARARLGLDAPAPRALVRLGKPLLTLKGKGHEDPTG
jgi:hypothetical protein